MDLGECPKIHDNALRADYNNAKAKKDYFYDIDVRSHCAQLLMSDISDTFMLICLYFVQKAMEHLENFINDCDRKVEIQKRRLKETQEELSDETTKKVTKYSRKTKSSTELTIWC